MGCEIITKQVIKSFIKGNDITCLIFWMRNVAHNTLLSCVKFIFVKKCFIRWFLNIEVSVAK